MAQRRGFICEDDLGFIDLGAFKAAETPDLVHGKFGEQRQETGDVRILGVAPELPEIERRKAVVVEPDGAIGRFAHLGAGRGGDQRRGQPVDFLSVDPACQVDPGDDVAPLVGTAHLQQAAIAPTKFEEVIGLQNGIVEFEEGERLLALEPELDRIHAKHAVDGEMRAVVPKEPDIGKVIKP